MPNTIDHCTSYTAEMEYPAPPGLRWTTVLAADACENCRDGRSCGHDHVECCRAELRRIDACPEY